MILCEFKKKYFLYLLFPSLQRLSASSEHQGIIGKPLKVLWQASEGSLVAPNTKASSTRLRRFVGKRNTKTEAHDHIHSTSETGSDNF